jgi:DNA-binding NarL/FixJ family response regulator
MRKLVLKKPPENNAESAKTPVRRADQEEGVPAHVRFAQVYDLVSDGIRIVDTDCNILYLNWVFGILVRNGTDASVGAKCYDAFPNRDCHTERCPLSRLQSGETEVQQRIVRRCADGRARSGTLTTRPLWGSNRKMAGMITGFRDTTEIGVTRRALGRVQQLLEAETRTMESKSVALKEVLSQIEDEKSQMSLRIQANLAQVIIPMMSELAMRLGPEERRQLEEIEQYLGDVMSPFVNSLATRFVTLTPREIEICNLLKSGLSTKEIAGRTSVSEQTVFKQRRNIRKKLRIADGETNLSAYLQSI